MCIAPMTEATKPGLRGEREGSRKTIARGMPDRFGLPVVTTLVCFFSSHAGPWVLAEAPGIPCALFQLRVLLPATRTRQRRENEGPCVDPHPAHRSLRSRCASPRASFARLGPRKGGGMKWRRSLCSLPHEVREGRRAKAKPGWGHLSGLTIFVIAGAQSHFLSPRGIFNACQARAGRPRNPTGSA